jgi:hypothetical protein
MNGINNTEFVLSNGASESIERSVSIGPTTTDYSNSGREDGIDSGQREEAVNWRQRGYLGKQAGELEDSATKLRLTPLTLQYAHVVFSCSLGR